MDLTDLDIIIARIQDKDEDIQKAALTNLQGLIMASNGTVGVKQQNLFDRLEKLEAICIHLTGDVQKHLYDLLSIMNMFNNDQKVLKYKLKGMYINIATFGLQYVRKLMCCILDVIYQKLETEDYRALIAPIVRYLFTHNAEIEAIDFIIEVSFVVSIETQQCEKNKSFEEDYTQLLLQQIDASNRERVLGYLQEMSKFYHLQNFLLKIYEQTPASYLVYLLKMNKKAHAVEYVKNLSAGPVKTQCLYILARVGIHYEADSIEDRKILENLFLSENFQYVAKALELSEPQKTEYVFKSIEKEKVEAAAISNAFVHFAYSKDPIFFPTSSDFKMKQEFANLLQNHKSIAVSASIGMIHSYSQERVIECYSSQLYEVPEIGAVLALAISSQRHHDLDMGNLHLLGSFLSSSSKHEVIAALQGISLCYAASGSQEVYDAVFPLISSNDQEVALFAIYVLGAVFAGTGDESIVASCIEMYNQFTSETSFSNFAILGFALIYMKCPHLYNTAVFQQLDKYIKTLAYSLMHVGSGNAEVVDAILTDAFTGDTDALLESIGLMSCCIVGLGDNIAVPLLERICNSSLLLDSSHLKGIYPLCMALLYASNPKPEVIDAIEKSLTAGDTDANALIALGIVGAGTKSARITTILDNNYSALYKDSRSVSVLLIAQGLVNLGKGLFSVSPLFFDSNYISDSGIIGLLSTLTIFFDQTIYPEFSFLTYLITQAITPKYVVGFEGACHVGKPVDVVGLTGTPNKLSGTVIHSLPVILNTNERAEVDEEVCTTFIEDVLVKKK